MWWIATRFFSQQNIVQSVWIRKSNKIRIHKTIICCLVLVGNFSALLFVRQSNGGISSAYILALISFNFCKYPKLYIYMKIAGGIRSVAVSIHSFCIEIDSQTKPTKSISFWNRLKSTERRSIGYHRDRFNNNENYSIRNGPITDGLTAILNKYRQKNYKFNSQNQSEWTVYGVTAEVNLVHEKISLHAKEKLKYVSNEFRKAHINKGQFIGDDIEYLE